MTFTVNISGPHDNEPAQKALESAITDAIKKIREDHPGTWLEARFHHSNRDPQNWTV